MPAQNPRYSKPEGCATCSLATLGFGFAPPAGPLGARLTFVGEALGYEEAVQGEPFYGSAGGVLSRLFHRAGIDRQHVRIANVINCRPPNDYLVGAPWEQHAIAMCRQYLQPVLDGVPDNAVVVPLGATALDAILGIAGVPGIAVKDFHGTISRDPTDRFWVAPTYHPSHLQRGAMNLLDVVTQDLKRAATIASNPKGFTRSPSQLVVDPHPDWFAAWVDNHLRLCDANPDGTHLSIDTEFPEKIGADESEVGRSDTIITRINGGNDRLTGWTVPAREPFLSIARKLIAGIAARQGWMWLWNKYVDIDKLRQSGFEGLNQINAIDGMWLWHHIQSDLPRGLGFVAPIPSDFGAWKHWGKVKEKEGMYAAADGLQNYRTCMWLMESAIKYGMWEMFMRDWHERDQYCLRPAHEMGVPINRVELENFHIELQGKLVTILDKIKKTAAVGVFKPKLGYPKLPKTKPPETWAACLKAKHKTQISGLQNVTEGQYVIYACGTCQQAWPVKLTPPASVLGKPKRGGGEAKQQYLLEGVRLVDKHILVDVHCCLSCGAEGVGEKHKCPAPKSARAKSQANGTQSPPLRPVARLEQRPIHRARWFWQLPFNPDAPAQILAYLAQQGIEAPIDRKKGRPTTNKKAMEALKARYRDDPFFEAEMDYKAVTKVDSTYAVGTLARLDSDDRVHPEYAPIPSTLRDSAKNPNLTNVVADKAGPQGLASGFRRCVEARDGIPKIITPEEYAAWESRWGGV
jgi:DNA polymerase